MTTSPVSNTIAHRSREWLVPTLLVVLSAVPVAGGAVRLSQLAGAAEITQDNARFFTDPWPVVLHIFSVTLYCVLGAFQFAPGLRRRRPNWYRVAGRVLVPGGLIAALSGLWMTQFYPPVNSDGLAVYAMRLLVGSAMVLFICLGFAAIRRHDIPGRPSPICPGSCSQQFKENRREHSSWAPAGPSTSSWPNGSSAGGRRVKPGPPQPLSRSWPRRSQSTSCRSTAAV